MTAGTSDRGAGSACGKWSKERASINRNLQSQPAVFISDLIDHYLEAELSEQTVVRISKRLDQVDIRPLPDPDAILHCRPAVVRVRMEPGVQHYAVDLVRRTRIHPFIHYGASPRASVALLLCSKALATIERRPYRVNAVPSAG